MPICVNRKDDVFEELIPIAEDQVNNIDCYPVPYALIVAIYVA